MSKPIKYKIALLTRGNPGLQRMRFLDALFYKEVFKNWNDYKIFKKDQKILNPGGDFFASEINFIEPCGYKQDENKKFINSKKTKRNSMVGFRKPNS